MQQEKELQKLLSSEAVSQRSIRDRVGVFIQATDAVDAISRIREAEQAGVRQIWSQGAGFADILAVFAVAASKTESIRLGTSIVPAYPRHPLVMAQQALAVHDVAPGRLRLGIGPGARILVEDWYGLSQTSPLSYLREYVEVVRDVLWEGKTSYHGNFFNVSKGNAVSNMVAPLQRKAQIPLLVSAVNPKAFRLAGEISDGAISWACPVPYLLNQALPELRAGAEARQRPAPPVIAHIQVALSKDDAAVLAATRRGMRRGMQIGPYARMFARAGFAGAVEGNEEDLDALARARVISGDEETVRSRLQELLASGLDELLLQLTPVADEEKERQQLLRLVGSL